MSEVFDIADRYVDRYAALDPISATFEGVTTHDAEVTDYSPEAAEERALLARSTLRALDEAGIDGDRDRVAADFMRERLGIGLEGYELGEHLRDVNVLGGPVQAVREVFDMMARQTEHDWQTVLARMAGVPHALGTIQDALDAGIKGGLTAAQRQVVGTARQAEVWAGTDPGTTRPFFLALVDEYDAQGAPNAALRADLEAHAVRATEAFASTARYLLQEYLPHAVEADPVGKERYEHAVRLFNGTRLDLRETYAWGWEELGRIEEQMARVGERILPGAPLGEVMDLLETDPSRAIVGEDAFRVWLQELLDRSVAELDGTHFDIPEPVRRVEAMIAPPGGAAAMYYSGPSEDFSRPGRTWYPTLGRTRFPLWGEVSTCYHEGVPGHHLQVAQVRYLAGALSRFQRTLGFTSGHGEGWALYAERLMGELGYLDVPDYELGMLRAQAMRAARVVIDIGLHLSLTIPAGAGPHAGEPWTPEIAFDLMREKGRFPDEFVRSEIDRYLGLPGQAISYKVGERVWLDARAGARQRHGADFDLKAWHAFALDLGPMGLDQLRTELARF